MKARALFRALRPHQWVKNFLIFVPLVAAHKLRHVDALMSGGVAWIVFSLCASAGYLVNDISDVESDRRHARKQARPFAAGLLDRRIGLGAATLLAIASLLLSFTISWQLAVVVGIYVAGTTAYTIWLRHVPVSDVFTLTGFYVLRIVAGGVATETPLSKWFLAFSLFFFLSLAFVKRYVELMATHGSGRAREYGPDDVPWIHAIGTSAGYMAVLVLALYVTAPEVTSLYARPDILWLLCPVLLFWLTRLWFRAGRRLVHDDPVVEALKDPVSYLTLVAAVVILAVATT